MSLAGNTVFALLMGLEDDLRRAIIASAGEHDRPFSESEVQQATERRQRDLGADAEQAGWHELLYYLDLGQKIEVANRIGEQICRQFALEPRALRAILGSLTALIPVRNRVCHGRPLETEDYSLVVGRVSELLADSAFPFDELARVYQRLRASSNDYPYTLVIPSFWQEGGQRVQHNLPTPDFEDTGFVGRDQDRKSLGQLILGAYPVINVTGEGGLGKTSLALRCLYDVLDSSATQFEAIVWTTLKTNRLTPGGIQTILGSLGNEIDALRPVVEMFQPEPADTEREAMYDQLVQIMGVFPILLAIDNLESIDVDSLRPLLLRIPHPSKVLLTSRIGMGDVEARYALEPLAPKDAVLLLRRVARLMNVDELTQRDDSALRDVCEKLFFNPLLIRWFVEGYSSGHSIPSLLNTTGTFKMALKFCFQNVYDRLRAENRQVLKALAETPTPLSEVEVALLAGIKDIDAVRSSLRYLQGSNLLQRSRDAYGAAADLTMWAITDFARLYVNTYDRPGPMERKRIGAEYRALMAGRLQFQQAPDSHAFRIQVIAARSTDEAQVLRMLRHAQELAVKRDYRSATARVEEARLLQPAFYEVSRVSAQLKALAGDDAGADEDFRVAIDLADGSSQPLLVYYSQFMRSRGNLDDAIDLLEPLARLPSAAPQLVAEYAWLRLLRGDAAGAANLYEQASRSLLALGGEERTVLITQHVATLRQIAESIPMSRLGEAAKPVVAALVVLANGCHLIGIDRSIESEGQKCFQLAAQIIATTGDRSVWDEVKKPALRVAQFFPLVGSETQGTTALEAKCPDVAASPEYRRIVQPDTTRATGSMINGTLQNIRTGSDYGFIRGSDSKDYFVFRTALRSKVKWEDLWERGRLPVHFVPGERPIGSTRAPKALEVELADQSG